MVDNKKKKEILDKLSRTNQIEITDYNTQEKIIDKQEREIDINKCISLYNLNII